MLQALLRGAMHQSNCVRIMTWFKSLPWHSFCTSTCMSNVKRKRASQCTHVRSAGHAATLVRGLHSRSRPQQGEPPARFGP